MQIALTYILIGITVITSLMALQNEKLKNDLIFFPPAVTVHKQWWRFITCGFIHSNIQHLAFNMFSFYFFGEGLEKAFADLFGGKGKLLFIVLYFTALVVCLLPTYFKNRNNHNYASLGASGAVSAIIFASIFMAPGQGIGSMMLPGIYIPGFVFGPLYLVGCVIMEKRSRDNINHSAHFWGAVYGLLFFIVACFMFSDVNPIGAFIEQVSQWFKKLWV